MPRFSRLAFVSAALASVAAPVLAQEDEVIPLDAITVTASSEPVKLSRTGATVTVVTAEEIEKAPLAFADYLSTLPGITLSANGGLGTQTSLRVRGLPAYYLGTRIDGINVTDAANPQVSYSFGGLTTAGLSRIEVLRGAQSALYGSEAVAGVIDITSWQPETEGTSGQASVEAGAQGTRSGSASVGLRTDRTELALTASRTVTDGISAYAQGTEADGFNGTRINATARHALTESLTIGAAALLQDTAVAFDNTGADADNHAEGRLRGGRVFAQFDTGAVWHELSLARARTERDVHEYGSDTHFLSDRDTLAYAGRWAALDTLSLNWGLEHGADDFSVASSWSTTAHGIRTSAAFAEALWSPRTDLDLSFALRHDDHSLFGGHDSGRLALAWRPDADWVLRAVAATGFRAPSPYELWSSYGKPTFQPETSRSFEIGAERLFEGGSISATLFDTRVEDQITFDSNSFTYVQQAGTTKSKGIELAGTAAIGAHWSLFGAYAYTDVTVREGTAERRGARAPRHNLTLGVDGRIGARLDARFSVTHVAGLWDEYVDYSSFPYATMQQKMSDYTVATLSMSYALTESAEATLRVENLFDESYQTARNFGQPGRSLYVGVRSKF
ncbi:TonB-dependent receptor plug domain-containing protein [Rhodobacter capsulatus]|uniref:TonB-dependent receptor plug domain-containing protein n=1 Tax=Rhodobacter capsulatus TaxID=1061 RepID=UPI00402818BF